MDRSDMARFGINEPDDPAGTCEIRQVGDVFAPWNEEENCPIFDEVDAYYPTLIGAIEAAMDAGYDCKLTTTQAVEWSEYQRWQAEQETMPIPTDEIPF